MGRQPCCEKEAVKKGPWSAEEDKKLVSFITAHGHGCWREVPKRAGLQRCGKSCRLRWINYLRPDLKRGMLSPQEESLIIQLHAALGNKWSRIAARLPGRTDNEIKNCWNTRIKKKMREMGIDPVTHNPISELETSTVTDSAESEELAPAIPAALNGPPIFIQTKGVSGPSSDAGIYPPSFSHTDTLNAMAHIYNMPLARRLHEGLAAGTSPGSVMNSQVESSLSHTPPATKYDQDEHSNNCADSVSQDHGSNVLHLPLTCQIPPHQLHAQPHVQHNPTQVHLLPNSPYVLARCQGMSIPLQTPQNATHLQNALHLLPQVPHRGAPPAPLHPIHLSQLHPSVQTAQLAPHLLPVYQLEGLQMPLPSFSKGTEGSEKPSSSSNNIGVSRLKEGEEGDIRTDDESMSCTTDISSRTIKTNVNERAGLSQALQWEIKAEEKAGDSGVANVGGGQYWSAVMSDQAFLSDALGGEPEQLLQAMSPLELHEASQALIGQQNFGSAGNYPLTNVGSWSNIDCLVSEPNMVTKYSLY